MKKVILFSLMLVGSSLNANLVQPLLPDNINQEAIQQVFKLIEKNELTQNELVLLLKAEEEAEVIGVTTMVYTVVATALIYTAYRLGLREIRMFNEFCEKHRKRFKNS